MTVKQKKFADEYIISGNATESAIKAGYSKRTAGQTGSENLKKPYIKAYIDARLKEMEKPKIATADEVLQTLTAIMRQEIFEEVVELNPATGQFIRTTKKPNISEVIRAASELMKRYPTANESKKLKLEIEKLQQQIGGDEENDDKIASYITALKEVISSDTE